MCEPLCCPTLRVFVNAIICMHRDVLPALCLYVQINLHVYIYHAALVQSLFTVIDDVSLHLTSKCKLEVNDTRKRGELQPHFKDDFFLLRLSAVLFVLLWQLYGENPIFLSSLTGLAESHRQVTFHNSGIKDAVVNSAFNRSASPSVYLYLSGIQSNFTGRYVCKDLIRPIANEVNI